MTQQEIAKLETDLQTRNDLSITQNPYGEYELVSLFSTTRSKGGKAVLRNWILNPVSDFQTLNNRIKAICAGGIPHFTIDGDALDFIEYYLNYDAPEPTMASEVLSYYEWLKDKFQNNPWSYVKLQGCRYLCELVYEFRRITSIPQDPGLPDSIKQIIHTIRLYLDSQTLSSIPVSGRIQGCCEIDYLDYLFRNKGKLAIRGLLEIVYEQDAFCSAHRIAEQRGYCYPELSTDSTELTIKGFFHPSLPHAIRNDWSLKEKHINIFTGSNMAGKSTTLKALSSAVWLSQAGLPVPATSMRSPVYAGIFTSINLPDSLKRGESHFYAEVLRVKSILQKVKQGKPYFIVFDELFRGTNARDAFEASDTVLGLLKEYTKSKFLISTHIIELAEVFYSESTCSFHHMESEIKDDQFICSYKLKEGISESRIGSWLVKKELSV